MGEWQLVSQWHGLESGQGPGVLLPPWARDLRCVQRETGASTFRERSSLAGPEIRVIPGYISYVVRLDVIDSNEDT